MTPIKFVEAEEEFLPCKSDVHKTCIGIIIYDSNESILKFIHSIFMAKIEFCPCECHK